MPPKLKSLFDTPQRARLTLGCLLVALATLAAVLYVIFLPRDGGSAPDASPPAVSDPPAGSEPPGESPPPAGIVPTLTMDEARAIALEHAGVDEDRADVSREALETDNGVWVYAFQFRTEQARYEYKINANTGDVRTMIREVFPDPAPETDGPSPSPLPAESESPAPAETASPPSAEPQPTQSGEPSPSPDPSPPPSMYLGAARARAIALEHAGLTAAQVNVTGTVIRRDNGAVIYEIRFRQDQTRYEYKIDAQSGAVLGHEVSEG